MTREDIQPGMMNNKELAKVNGLKPKEILKEEHEKIQTWKHREPSQ